MVHMDSIVLLYTVPQLVLLLLLLDTLARRRVGGGLAAQRLDNGGVDIVRLSETGENLVHFLRRAVVAVPVDGADNTGEQLEAGLVRLDEHDDALHKESVLSATQPIAGEQSVSRTHVVLWRPAVDTLAAVAVDGHDPILFCLEG